MLHLTIVEEIRRLFRNNSIFLKQTRKYAIVEYLHYQIPLTQLMGPKGNGDMQAAKRD